MGAYAPFNMSGIKNYIIDIDNINNDDKKKIKKEEIKYDIVTSNDMDVVIRRTCGNSIKELTLIMSKCQFYIRTIFKSKENIAILNSNSSKTVNMFLKDFCKQDHADKLPRWVSFSYAFKELGLLIKNLCDNDLIGKSIVPEILSALYCNDTTVDVFVHKVLCWRELKSVVSKIEKDKNLILKLLKVFDPDTVDLFHIYSLKLPLHVTFEGLDNNNLDKLLSNLKDLGTVRLDNCSEPSLNINTIANTYGLSLKRAIEYITIDMTSQGLEYFNGGGAIYKDYLRMNKDMFGEIKDKYPKYLHTEHDKTRYKYNIWVSKHNSILFEDIYNENKYLEFSCGDYSIIVPKASNEIIEEGFNQCHCVASYVNNVVERRCLIVFMRQTDTIEASLITIEIVDKSIRQVRGKCNRRPTDKEREFIKKWANKFNLLY